MNCETFRHLVIDIQKQRLTPEVQEEALAHRAVCAECAWLLEPPPVPLGSQESLDLTTAILARTTGSPCTRLQELACDLVDGELEETQIALVTGHLEHCMECSALIASLVELEDVLPGLAILEPGPRFTEELLGATIHFPSFNPTPWTYSWPELRDFWVKLLRRPRICFEAAYLGTVAGVLVINIPLPRWPAEAGIVELAHQVQPGSLLPPLVNSAKRLAMDVAVFERKSLDVIRRGGTGLEEAVLRQARRVNFTWHRVSREVIAWLQHLGQRLRSDPAPEEIPSSSAEPSSPSSRSSS